MGQLNLSNYIREYREKQLRLKFHFRDYLQKLRFGAESPVYQELIYVNPMECEFEIDPYFLEKKTGIKIRALSGKVVNWKWPIEHTTHVQNSIKYKYCFAHWVEQKTWEEAGAYDYLMKLISERGKADNCSTYKEVVERFERLDQYFAMIKKEGKMRSRMELNKNNFRETNGVIIHLGPNGDIYFGGGGNHRFAIARILNLKMPAVIGCVHYKGIAHINRFREN